MHLHISLHEFKQIHTTGGQVRLWIPYGKGLLSENPEKSSQQSQASGAV